MHTPIIHDVISDAYENVGNYTWRQAFLAVTLYKRRKLFVPTMRFLYKQHLRNVRKRFINIHFNLFIPYMYGL